MILINFFLIRGGFYITRIQILLLVRLGMLLDSLILVTSSHVALSSFFSRLLPYILLDGLIFRRIHSNNMFLLFSLLQLDKQCPIDSHCVKIRHFYLKYRDIECKFFPFYKNGLMKSFREVQINQHSGIVPKQPNFCSII